ncbi:YgaP family membrane protein [Marinifilum sp. RC60d5]|uniref:YgaP family membrane protein n=1 Tax=Marinifilum sp. RC60d5 TaxID=3458414 RepID=UPI00403548A2
MRERIIRGLAGTIVLVSVLLAAYVNENWLLLTAFVGLNLLQSSITKWCLMDDILKKVFKVED